MGFLTKYRIERVTIEEKSWCIFLGQWLSEHGLLVDARSKQPLIFKTLDGALSAIEDIGFTVLVLR